MFYRAIYFACRIVFSIKLLFIFCITPISLSLHADTSQLLSSNYKDISFMKILSEQGGHDLEDENWNLYGQATYISSWKLAFPAGYTNFNGTPNSLIPHPERSFTGSVTAYLGLKPWKGGEIYLVPEMISESPLSDLKGLGGAVQNFELQKSGTITPIWYRSRFYIKHYLNLGGESKPVISAPMQLGGTVDSRRLVFTVGNLSILDIFDKNTYAGDLRQQFFNMAFLTHAAYDFAADARGYSFGMALEYYFDDWTARFGHFAGPKNPNDLPLDYRLFKYYGDQFELEHRHKLYDHPGAIRLLGYRNNLFSGRFDDAINAYQTNPVQYNATTCTSYNYSSANVNAPDLCWARKANIKMGIGINVEQSLADDIGLFLRGMYSDGQVEVFSYLPADRSFSFGSLMTGKRWGRIMDSIGIGYGISWLSSIHVDYLNRGGADGFIGDGKINYHPEQVVNIFYKLNLNSPVWITLDYQHIVNPAFNADRGPVDIFGARAHFEF